MIGYTTEEKVLYEAGLHDNDKVDIEVVKMQIDGAEGIINGTIGEIYAMPLPFHIQNSVEFKGNATAAGTVTITINGIAHTVVVTNGQTAEEIADTFREALKTSTTLQVDTTYDRPGSATVYFLSVSMIYATAVTQVDVTATAMGTVTGTTVTEATYKVKRFPFIVELITRQLAAAMLLSTSFGKSAAGSDNDGAAKMENAYKLLDKISNKEIKVIDDFMGGEIARSGSILPQYNPTAANTDLDNTDAAATPQYFKYRNFF
jgi:hypothetical protein